MAKPVKMSDIAQKLHISNVTVSKALAGKDGVSEELRKKIIQLAEEMGYRSASLSKGARSGVTYNIGILVPERFVRVTTKSFYWELYQKLCNALAGYDYYGVLEVLSTDDEEKCTLPRMIPENKVDGMLVVGQVSSPYISALLKEEKMPIVFLDAYDKHFDYDVVLSDNFFGMYLLTDYLVQAGHREITFVGN